MRRCLIEVKALEEERNQLQTNLTQAKTLSDNVRQEPHPVRLCVMQYIFMCVCAIAAVLLSVFPLQSVDT